MSYLPYSLYLRERTFPRRPRVAQRWLCSLLISVCPLQAAVQPVPGGVEFSGAGFAVRVSDSDGSFTVLQGAGGPLANSGAAGLWRLELYDGVSHDVRGNPHPTTEVTASDFLARPGVVFSSQLAGSVLTLTYTEPAPGLTVTVTVTEHSEGIDLAADVAVSAGAGLTVLSIDLPADLRFDPADLQRFIGPNHSSDGVGMAFNPLFFQAQAENNAATWTERPQADGGLGYRTLFGDGLVFEDATPVPLSFTAEGSTWLGASVQTAWNGTDAVVNRPPASGQWDLVLVDSARGPYFSGSRLGGAGGYLLRIGGNVNGQSAVNRSLDLVSAAVGHLAVSPGGRSRVAVLSMERGPVIGESWPSEVRIDEWIDRLSATLSGTGLEMVVLEDYTELTTALSGTDVLAVLNPYGENLPVSLSGGIPAAVSALRDYVHAGGNWFEVGGHPFFFALEPVLFYDVDLPYPPAFADFQQLEAGNGTLAVYGVQPVLTDPAHPWDSANLFVPGNLQWGADAAGGYFQRSFVSHVQAEETWNTPAVRLSFGLGAEAALDAYAAANGITRGLDQKIPSATTRQKFRQSLLLRVMGSATELSARLPQIPAPSLLHFTQYLKGGFDREYPDHLPVASSFGTEAEFQTFLSSANAAGHLTMPYTNPTFWGVNPKGPTWTALGNDDPLLRNPDGSLNYEEYFGHGGFTATPWHPAVRAANAKTIDLFTGDPENHHPGETSYQVDFFFQDQVGARTWDYDANPASPTEWAYMHGIIALNAEDSTKLPVSTENGFDRIINFQSQFCGLAWGLVPTPGAPFWRRFLSDRYDPATWEIFPLAQHLAHDKLGFTYNNLGASTANDETVAWALGLGYGMTYFFEQDLLDDPAFRGWLAWIDRVQKSVAARFIGAGITAFDHQWGADLLTPENGTILATYGTVEVIANLSPSAATHGERTLAPHGFLATAPGLMAARQIEPGGSMPQNYVAELNAEQGADLWIYAEGGRTLTVELPPDYNGPCYFQWEGEPAVNATVSSNLLTVTLPVGVNPGVPLLWRGTAFRFASATNGSGTATLTDYRGPGGAVELPASLGGMAVTEIGSHAFDGESAVTSVVIPDSVETIGDYAFHQCTGLTAVTFGAGVVRIGTAAFQGCTALESVTLPDSVTHLGDFAFFGNTGLTSFDPGNGLLSIGQGGFQGCTGLMRMTLPDTVNSLGPFAFSFNGVGFTELLFTGDAPTSGNDVFSGSDGLTVFHLPGTLGWTSPWNGRPVLPWDPRPMQPGLRPNGFGFDIVGSGDFTVLIRASDRLDQPDWLPRGTLRLAGGTVRFHDPDWEEADARFYRFELP